MDGSVERFKRVKKWSCGENSSGNFLIQADNLKALRALASTHRGAVKCAYLDPPYNNGESYRHYFDSLGHEEWLHAVTARLRAVKELLRDDGSLWISIDDSELHYLKVACDSVFGRQNFIATVVWERRTTRENRRALSRNHEYLLVYAANGSVWTKSRNLMPVSEDIEGRYKNPDNDARGPWQSISANAQDGHATPQQFYTITSPSGRVFLPPKGRCWVYSKPRMLEEIRKNNIWFGKNGSGVPRIKSFLSNRKGGVVPETLWLAKDVGTTSEAKKELIALFDEEPLFDTPKPERLIHRVLSISTNPGDLVLDTYLGSGTTTAVAHKMGRRYIGIEIGDHATSHCARRMRLVIEGEEGGISSAANWNGGGGMEFLTLPDKASRDL
jgi:adenine-specific DNA-methyltransferase